MIAAHGGRLINRVASGATRDALLARAGQAGKLALNARELADFEMLAVGAMSPLEGFMGSDDLASVVSRCRLANGVVWPMPVTLSAKGGRRPERGQDLALTDEAGSLLGLIEVSEVYSFDKNLEAQGCLGTTDKTHPGVQYLDSIGADYVAGPVWLLDLPAHGFADEFRLTPRETRVLFKAKGWNSIVAFQTRNPIHRAHEYLTKTALEQVDGLLIHPLVGETKSDDVPARVRMDCYRVLLEKYYPKERVTLAVYPQAMRYAGPREAVLHALCRKNYGCTHFIVGRDHAGVGSFYGSFDAQSFVRSFDPAELGIEPLMFENAFWDKRAGAMATAKTSAARTPEEQIMLSGTKVREMLRAGIRPPEEFTRPEVAEILIKAMAQKTPVA